MMTDSHKRALTLVETMLATSILVTLMGLMFWFYNSSLDTRQDGLKRNADLQLVRVILDRMADEIRTASGNTPGYGAGLVGFKHALSINTLVVPDRILSETRSIADEEIAGQFDLQEIRYYIAWDEENLDENGDPRALGLVRRVSKTFNRGFYLETGSEEEAEEEEALAVKEELYAPEIKYLDLRYFDGLNWWETWELAQGNSLPVLVRITIGFVPVLPEDEERDLIEDEFLRPEQEREELAPDRHTILVKLVQSEANPLGVRLQREASALAASEEAL
jgi:hypothetical protein